MASAPLGLGGSRPCATMGVAQGRSVSWDSRKLVRPSVYIAGRESHARAAIHLVRGRDSRDLTYLAPSRRRTHTRPRERARRQPA